MHTEQDGVDYYNSGGWIDARLTYITIGDEGVEIHEYRERLTIVIPAKNEAKLIPTPAAVAGEAGLFEDVEYEGVGR